MKSNRRFFFIAAMLAVSLGMSVAAFAAGKDAIYQLVCDTDNFSGRNCGWKGGKMRASDSDFDRKIQFEVHDCGGCGNQAKAILINWEFK